MLGLLQKLLCGHLIDRRHSAELGVRTQLRGELSLGLDLSERLHFLVFLSRLQVNVQTYDYLGNRLSTWPTGTLEPSD